MQYHVWHLAKGYEPKLKGVENSLLVIAWKDNNDCVLAIINLHLGYYYIHHLNLESMADVV